MFQSRWIKIGFCLAMAVAAPVFGADDTARFKGTWKASFPFNGQTVTMESVHDDAGYTNYIVLPEGIAHAGNGKFKAVDGKWTATAAAPNDSGTYQFTDDNDVLCKNAVGQALLWQRDAAPLPPVVGVVAPPGGAVLPAGTNLIAVKSSEAIDVGRKMASAWSSDAILFFVRVVGPSSDGTVNLLANPTAFGMLFYSPSTKSCLGVGSGPMWAFYSAPKSVPDYSVLRSIPTQALDLADAYTAARTCGFNGAAISVEMSFSNEHDKPVRLVWVFNTGEMYPRVVSAASGAVLSPFQVVDDKVADYNQLVAETQAAIRMNSGRNGRAHSPWASAGLHFWSGEPHEGGSENQGGGSADETDTWDNEVAAQNAWDNGDSDAEARFDAGTPSETDQINYGE